MNVVWSPLAVDQATQAYAAIAAERPLAARRWLEELIDRASALAQFPDMGRMVPEAGRPSIREVLVGPYRLIYRRDEVTVVILTLHHVRRELGRQDVRARAEE